MAAEPALVPTRQPPAAGTATRSLAATLLVALGMSALACAESPSGPVPVCGDEPVLPVGRTVEGRLSDADDRLAGAYIDYYSLQLPERRRLTITLASPELTPLLVLLDENGAAVEQSFPAYAPPDAPPETTSISWGFDAGCHLIGASSYAPDATGVYEITVAPQPPL
ncbi:MAG: hypothetical protein ACOCUW_02170 [Gemmatimonadota bacterium]